MTITTTAEPEVRRHDTTFSVEYLADRAAQPDKAMAIGYQYLPNRPSNVEQMFSIALRSLCFRATLDPDDPNILRDLKRITQLAVFRAEIAAAGGAARTLRLDGFEPIDLTRAGGKLYSNDFLTGLSAAMVLRDEASVATLANADLDVVLPPGGPNYPIAFARFMQALLSRSPDTGDRLIAALKATDPERVGDDGLIESALYRFVPQIEVYHSFSTTDQQLFDDKLRLALERHRFFYVHCQPNPGESQIRDEKGFISLPLSAAAAYGLDNRRQVNVRSDYILKAAIER